MNLDELAAHLIAKWGSKTLTDFRHEAEREKTGTVFETLRIPAGKRIVFIACLTDSGQIGSAERALNIQDNGHPADWDSLTMAEAFQRAVMGTGVALEWLL